MYVNTDSSVWSCCINKTMTTANHGFETNITGQISHAIDIPVIASGGAGTMEHIKEAFECGAEAALAASIFHFKEIDILDLKRYLIKNHIPVRL